MTSRLEPVWKRKRKEKFVAELAKLPSYENHVFATRASDYREFPVLRIIIGEDNAMLVCEVPSGTVTAYLTLETDFNILPGADEKTGVVRCNTGFTTMSLRHW